MPLGEALLPSLLFPAEVSLLMQELHRSTKLQEVVLQLYNGHLLGDLHNALRRALGDLLQVGDAMLQQGLEHFHAWALDMNSRWFPILGSCLSLFCDLWLRCFS